MNHPAQFSLFDAPASPIDPIIGVYVDLKEIRRSPCRCGETVAVIGAGKSNNAASLHCVKCGHWRDWLRKDAAEALLALTRCVGRPTEPVIIQPLSPEFAALANTTASSIDGAQTSKDSTVPKISETFPSKYLKASDLQGRDHKVIFSNVVNEKLGEDIKPVATYKGWVKTHPMNKVVSLFVADALGDDTDGWVGKTVIIYPTTEDYKGKRFEVIRVRLPAARDAKLAVSTSMPAPSDDDEPPFDNAS